MNIYKFRRKSEEKYKKNNNSRFLLFSLISYVTKIKKQTDRLQIYISINL